MTRPAIGSLSRSGPQLGLTVNGQTGPDYIFQASTNLAVSGWMTLSNSLSPTPPVTFVETNTSVLPKRFYRVLLGP